MALELRVGERARQVPWAIGPAIFGTHARGLMVLRQTLKLDSTAAYLSLLRVQEPAVYI